jgi:preprotein translocase subunit SecA
MIARILAKILGTVNERELRSLRPIIAKINAFEAELELLPSLCKTVFVNENKGKY